jgi:NADPH-dependent 2,4-dienoyl-CoA reductase/sulfur reductase-like enzyme
MGKKVLIVGGVAGGASTAARLRRLDETAEIILFERGEYISYANCGLPYHVGDVIKSRESLLLQTPEGMKAKFRLDVRTRQEVTAIDRENKSVTVKDLQKGITYTETYDVLVLATGSSPLTPPIPGRESPRVMTLWTVPDTDKIRAFIRERNAKSAVVVGGGFIGLEMAENLNHAGLEVTIAEMLDQVMAPLDYEMAQLLHEHLAESGVRLCLSDGVASFEDIINGITVKLKSGREIKTDLVILSIGVKPNSALAKDADLQVSPAGGIVTDSHMRTSDAK